MPSWWTVVEGSGLQNCPHTLVKKLNGLSWITQAAWKNEPNGFHLALECVFTVTDAADAKKRMHKELNPKQGPIGKQLPDAKFKIIKFGTAGERFVNFYCDFVGVKTISEAIECVPDAAPSKAGSDDWAMLGLPLGASPDAVTKAYKEQALIWHPDKSTGDLRHFQALQQAYKRIAGIPDALDAIRTMTVEPKLTERIANAMVQARKFNAGDAPQEDKDRVMVEHLVQLLTSEEANEGQCLMQEYFKELEKAQMKARNWSVLLGRAVDGHAQLQKREHAKKIAERFKESVKYWPAGYLMNEWFQPTNKYKSARAGNEDLDPYTIFDKFIIIKTQFRPVAIGKLVEVRVGRDLKDAVDHGEKHILPMELFWNKHYHTHFDYLGFDMDIAEEMHCYDRFNYLFSKGLASNPANGMSLNVRAASALYHNHHRAMEDEQYQKRSEEVWAEYDKRAARARAIRDAVMFEDTIRQTRYEGMQTDTNDLVPTDRTDRNKRPREEPTGSSDSGDDSRFW